MSSPAAPNSLRLVTGGALRVGPKLGEGGEGTVYKTVTPANQALKQYAPNVLTDKNKGPMLAAKLQVMVDNAPSDPTLRSLRHVSLAWPRVLVVDGAGHFAGYVMPLIDKKSSVELHEVENPSDRKRSRTPWLAGFTWEYLVRIAQNLASATQALHDASYVIGDFNERNVYVRMNTLVTMVDCDSMQVPGPSGSPFLCAVYRPEYTAPELLHTNLHKQARTQESDLFPLAVHIYQLLMEGRHPFAGRWHLKREKPPLSQLAEDGLFAQMGDKRLTPQAGTPPFTILPGEVRELFLRAFVEGAHDPDARPSALEWFHVLRAAADTLVTCKVNNFHRYAGHLHSCPWCESAAHQQPMPPAVTPAPPTPAPRPAPAPRPPTIFTPPPPTVHQPGPWQPPQWQPSPKPIRLRKRRGGCLLTGLIILLGWLIFGDILALGFPQKYKGDSVPLLIVFSMIEVLLVVARIRRR